MKKLIKIGVPLLLLVGILAMSGTLSSCSSEKTMYERQKTNKSRKVNSNIKVRGTNHANGHTTRSY